MQAAASIAAPAASPAAAGPAALADELFNQPATAVADDAGGSPKAPNPDDAFAEALAALMATPMTPVASPQPATSATPASDGAPAPVPAAAKAALLTANLLHAAPPPQAAPASAEAAAAPGGQAAAVDAEALELSLPAAPASGFESPSLSQTTRTGDAAKVGPQDAPPPIANAASPPILVPAALVTLTARAAITANPSPIDPKAQASTPADDGADAEPPGIQAAAAASATAESGASAIDDALAAAAPVGAPSPPPALAPARPAVKATSTPSTNSDDERPAPTAGPSIQASVQPAPLLVAAADDAPADRADTPADPDTQGAVPKTDKAPDAQPQAITATAAPAAPPTAGAPAPQPPGPAIVGQIARQVIKAVDAKSTRFEIALQPAGLGQVNVKVEIGAAGQVSATLSFDNPHAAAEARAHAGELQHALEQAGFNLGQNALSFDVGGQGASLARQDQGQRSPAFAGPAAPIADEPPIPTAAIAAARPSAGGVNLLI
jgi:hypothetical protein